MREWQDDLENNIEIMDMAFNMSFNNVNNRPFSGENAPDEKSIMGFHTACWF